ncbi:MAG: hypothetical protein KF825_04110 [Ferruginibacter sp.]|nr:hypothetical protein [Ferruginibacter sp.]
MKNSFSKTMKQPAALLYVAILYITLLASCKKDNGGSSFPGGAKKLTYTASTEALSEGRFNMQVYKTGNYTCFTGGEIFSLPNNKTFSSNTDVYNKQTGSWTRFGLSVKRDKYAAAALNDKLLIAGGINSNFTYSAVTDIFDLATGQATTTQLSQPRGYLAAAGAGNKILFAGGHQANNKVSARVDIYNTQTGQWTIDSLSLARGQLVAGAVGNKLVFAGGLAQNSNGEGYYTNRVDIYDVQTGQWTQATLSQPRTTYYNAKVLTAGNKLFIAGGATTTNSETVDVYDAQTNQWTSFNLTGNTIPYYIACTNGSQVFITSGSNTTFNYTRLHIYNVQTGQVNSVPFPEPIRGLGMAAIENKVVIAAGIIDNKATDKVFVYDTQTGLFDTTGFKLPQRKFEVTAASAGNKLLFAGGVIDEQPAGQPRRVENFKTVSVFELK